MNELQEIIAKLVLQGYTRKTILSMVKDIIKNVKERLRE